MPFNRPTLPELQGRIRADIRARLPTAKPELRRSLLGVLADVEAGSIHGFYGYLDFLSRQILPDTAAAEYLLRHVDIWGLSRQPATPATGDVTLTGTDGAILPQGALLSYQDGTEYSTDAAATIDGGIATVAVTATVLGTAGNRAAGDTLTLVEPTTGIDSTATVGASGLTGGAEAETDDRLRNRLLARIRRPPHGGAPDDYKAWALEGHPDVTRAWVYPLELGQGTVSIRITTDDLSDPIPTQGTLDAVQAYIDSVRPVTADAYVVAPIAAPLDMTILITPDTAEVRQRIEQAVNDFILLNAEPGGILYHSQLNGVIYVAAGESLHDLQVPSGDIDYSTGELATSGVITWV